MENLSIKALRDDCIIEGLEKLKDMPADSKEFEPLSKFVNQLMESKLKEEQELDDSTFKYDNMNAELRIKELEISTKKASDKKKQIYDWVYFGAGCALTIGLAMLGFGLEVGGNFTSKTLMQVAKLPIKVFKG